jgi:hypothetical protein
LSPTPTPSIDRLLARLRARLVREVCWFGVGRTLLATSVWLLFIFLVDWTLHVPAAVRVVHLVVLVGLPAALLWRELVARLRQVPDEVGLAVLLERAHPDLRQLLVSAVELRDREAAADADPALVARVVAEAEARAAALELEGTTDPRPARSALGLGALATAAATLVLLWQAEAASVFLRRIAGGPTPWPQRTFLVVEVPLAGELLSTRDRLDLRVARGSDLPIVVRAEGRVPEEVTIHFAGGDEALLGSSGRGVFRTLLRAVQEDLTFHVTGGDDRDGTPEVRVEVLQPPDVAGLAVRVEPPAYSGLPPRLELDRDVEVLAGSRVTVTVLPDPPGARGVVRLLPSDEVVELRAAPFPPAAEGEPERQGLAFELEARESLRFRVELEDDTGLSNPDPGLFAVQVREDRPPEVTLLAPARGEMESVVGGALPLKAIASDDFGLADLRWRWTPTAGGAGEPRSEPLATREPADPEVLRLEARGGVARYGARRVEVAELFAGAPPAEGEVFQLEVVATDNREPGAQESRSASARVRIVSADEFLRRVQDRLARVRGRAEALAALMRERHPDTLLVIAALEGDGAEGADPSALAAALSGARRVEGDADVLARDVAAVTETLLYSRLDERAGPLLDALEAATLTDAGREFRPGPWRELAARQADGSLAGAEFADRLVEITGLALELAEDEARGAVDALRRAQDLADPTARYDQLVVASERQAAARDRVEALLTLLSEWDSYQSLLAATRDLLNRQKNLLERTRQFYKDN